MKPGLVVSIRISPRDCQSIVALMDASGVSRQGQTFSGMASLALSSLLQTARTNGTIEEPDPFNYWNEVGEYHKGRARNKDKERIVQAASSKITPTMSTSIASGVVADAGLSQIGTVLTSDVRQAGIRLKELLVKQENAPNDWSAADQQEFDQLYKIVYPEG